MTRILRCDPSHFDPKELWAAATLIRNNEVVAFPTETVYGLGANAFNAEAVQKIFAAKGQPADNPLIVHIASIDQLIQISGPISDQVRRLTDHFWPGPLTLLFQKLPIIPDIVTAGLPTVAVRMPSHPIARKLIELAQVPIAAPSANLSGRPSPTTAAHVITDLMGKIPLIIDGGATNIGVESTVVDLLHDPPMILRPGGVTLEQLREFLPTIRVYQKNTNESLDQHPPTPGLKYRHYSPKAKVILFIGREDALNQRIITYINQWKTDPKIKLGILHTHRKWNYDQVKNIPEFQDRITIISLGFDSLSKKTEAEQIAHDLFNSLRMFDDAGVDIILAEGISENDQGLAVMNRLRKAASEIIDL